MRDEYGFSTVYGIMGYKRLEHFSNIIKWVVKLTNCKKYLEIGVRTGENIYEIRNFVELCEGVDMIDEIVDKDKIVFNKMSSDEFFKVNSNTYDVIFIDADHNFNQVKKDLENSLKILNKYGIIILHDTDPIENFLLENNFCSDSYKIVDYIYSHHPELNIINFPIHETGLTFVMRREDRRVFNFIEK